MSDQIEKIVAGGKYSEQKSAARRYSAPKNNAPKNGKGFLADRIIIYSMLALIMGGMAFAGYTGYRYLQVFESNFDRIDNRMTGFEVNFERIDDENFSINKKISELEEILYNMEEHTRELKMHNNTLQEENDALEGQRNSLEGENNELRNLLSMRYQTYQTATSQQGAKMQVLSPSHFSARQFDQAWKRLGATSLVGTGEAFVAAEQKTGVNALVLAAIAAHESAFGRSRIAQNKNNLFGYGAYDRSPYESAHTFNSHHEGILFVASQLGRNYLSRSGRYYRGGTLYGINTYYATDRSWADKVSRMMYMIAEASVDKPTLGAWRNHIS